MKRETVGTLLSAAAAHVPCETPNVPLEDVDSEEPSHNSQHRVRRRGEVGSRASQTLLGGLLSGKKIRRARRNALVAGYDDQQDIRIQIHQRKAAGKKPSSLSMSHNAACLEPSDRS